MSDADRAMSNKEAAAWLVRALKEDADEREVARIVTAVARVTRTMSHASIIVACARILAAMMEDAPDGQELEAYVSVHGMIDSFLAGEDEPPAAGHG